MNNLSLLFLLLLMAVVSYVVARVRTSFTGFRRQSSNLPHHFGQLVLLLVLLPSAALWLFLLWFETHHIHQQMTALIQAGGFDVGAQLDLLLNGFEQVNQNQVVLVPEHQPLYDHYWTIKSQFGRIKVGSIVITTSLLAVMVIGLIKSNWPVRLWMERFWEKLLLGAACIAIMITIGILFSVLVESVRFFEYVSISEFLFGTQWSPQISMRPDQVGSSGSFGAIPLFVGTLMIALIALLVAVPIGLMSAVYLAEYASPRVRQVTKPVMEILAGIPTVVYGFFAALTVGPWIRELGDLVGLSVATESALVVGVVMGVMIIPYVSSLSDDVLSAVPQSLRSASLAVGATRAETVTKVMIPAALPGIIGAIILAASRAIGETMIVVMAAGLAANLTANPLESVTTVTVQVVTLLTGDQVFDSPKTLSAFALGLVLFLTTLVMNVLAMRVVKFHRARYE